MKRKAIGGKGSVLHVILLIAILIMPACTTAATPTTEASQPEDQADPTTASDEPVTLVMWASTNEEGNPECRYTVPVEKFNSENSHIQVELVGRAPGGSEMRTVLAGGSEVPDLAETDSPDSVPPWVEGGLLLPLDEYAQQYGWTDIFLPWAYELGKVDGTLYALPNEMETLVLYINKTVFDEHGWEHPTTFAEYEELSAQIKEAGLIPLANGASADIRFVNAWITGEYINHVAGPEKVYQALTGEVPWTDPTIVESVQKLADHMEAGWIQNDFTLYKSLGWEDFHQSFASGEAPMMIDGTWLLIELANDWFPEDTNQDQWAWVPFPSTTGDPVFDLGLGSTLSINKNSAHPDEAAEFLDYLYSPEVAATTYAECSTAPAPIHLDAEVFQSASGVDPRAAELYSILSEETAAGNYGYTCWAFMTKQMCDVTFIDDVDRIFTQELTPEQWAEQLDEDYQSGVAEGLLPPIPPRQ